jgi:hypothetical protein
VDRSTTSEGGAPSKLITNQTFARSLLARIVTDMAPGLKGAWGAMAGKSGQTLVHVLRYTIRKYVVPLSGKSYVARSKREPHARDTMGCHLSYQCS